MVVLEPYKGGYYLWRYVPSLAAAAIFVLLFLTATITHCWRMWKSRAWFCMAFTIGGLFEFIGYAARCSAHSKTGKMMPFVIQNAYILLAPALFAASIYMTLGRIIQSVKGHRHSLVLVKWLTKLFVFGDILSFVVQGAASGLMVTGKSLRLGEDIVVAGLLIQLVMFGLFVATAIVFQVRLHRNPTIESYDIDMPWKQTLYMLYAVSVLVMVRSAFRVVEFIVGQDGYPLNHEWTLYIFDTLLMFSVMVIFYVWYPSKIRASPGNISDENRAVQMERINQTRKT